MKGEMIALVKRKVMRVKIVLEMKECFFKDFQWEQVKPSFTNYQRRFVPTITKYKKEGVKMAKNWGNKNVWPPEYSLKCPMTINEV